MYLCKSQVSVFGSAESRLCRTEMGLKSTGLKFTPIVFQVMSSICQSNDQIIGSLSIAIVTILSPIPIPIPLPHSISVITIAVVGVSFWLWLGGSLAVAIGGWCRVGRCPLFEGDAKQKQAHLEEKIISSFRVIVFTRRRKWSLMLFSLVLRKSASL